MHLYSLLTELEKGNDKSRTKALKMIKFIDKSKQMHLKILAALGKSHGGDLWSVNVPIEVNRVTTGWITVTDSSDLQQLIVDRNRGHLQQAEQTPFGTGAGYEMLHGEGCFRKILDRQFTHKLKNKEVEKWVKHLKRCYNETS